MTKYNIQEDAPAIGSGRLSHNDLTPRFNEQSIEELVKEYNAGLWLMETGSYWSEKDEARIDAIEVELQKRGFFDPENN